MTLQPSQVTIFEDLDKLTLSQGDSRAKRFQLLAKDEDLRTLEGLCFSRLPESPKKSNHGIYCLKTLRGYYLTGGQTFGVILNTLDELGYDTEWQLLNTKDFSTKVFLMLPLTRHKQQELVIANFISKLEIRLA